MDGDTDDRVYYVISDLHIGGDEQLVEMEFRTELLDFLERLERTDENAELIINGDAFGLWEFTKVDGIEKFDVLEETYPELFDQFRATGANVQITLLPGNHDHELAAYDGYIERFAEYNVDLVPERSLSRSVGEQVIHFEHGHQRDQNNRIEDWGNPHSTPLGYYYNTLVTSRAGQLSDRGRYNWLKDVQAVTPTERMPIWLFSKYFYREMNPVLRYSLIPFLLLFNISALLAILAGLDLVGVWPIPVDRTTEFLGQFGRAGTAAWFLLTINVAVAGLLLLVWIPLHLIRRDIKKTVDRFGIFETDLTVDPEAPYEEAAREVFDEQPEKTIFCYGHTHRPTLREVDGGIMVNTGTWLKRLHRRDGIIGILPPVFYPSYQLIAARIAPEADGVSVEFEQFTKPSPATEELTRTERFFTVGREPELDLPDRYVVEDENAKTRTRQTHN
ncbi:metallophosphoesterase [Natronobacterium gregoryi]|uniref:Phosphoesterase n=2 Tax=Natronobacterium gregoryi TaxID=44930 RepID=L0AGU3_NATGS|nr:metallophosphoesterase [Natronobacterium gregoryi]AFZ72387.1 putative phosphoesterase, ICC [Natronobacterium gregoryi SP2]ELY64228.1 metallophosphoesterase [Natronobacterium gregoryi SP2]PLK20300.1 phosphoesterase [Natronobacterium gregoryi SP2]SFJ21413.1 putative phosphoesterase [Natronobacterium gregoryi]